MSLTDEARIIGLRSGDQTILEEIYESNYKSIERMVLKNSGNEDEAKDIFQDTMIIFYKNVTKPEFELKAKISTYLYAISRRLWLKRLREKSHLTFSEADGQIDAFDFELVSKNPNDTMMKVVELLKEGGKNCLEILKRIYFHKQSFEYIADELGYASGQVVREQKYRCIKRVRKGIESLKLSYNV